MMKPTKQNFSLGQLVATRGVDNLMNRNQAFRAFVQLSREVRQLRLGRRMR